MQKRIRASASDLLSEIVKRVSVSSVGELRVPGDVLSILQTNLDKFLSKVVSKIDVNSLLDDLARDYKIRISAEVILEPKKSRATKKKRK